MTEAPIPYESRTLSKSQLEQLALDEAEAGQANTLGLIVWLDRTYSDALVEQAVNHIIEHEQALRLRLGRNAGGYTQYEQPYAPVRIPVLGTTMKTEGFIEKCEREMAAFSFALEAPLYDFNLIHLIGPQGGQLGLRAFFHHAIIDGAGAGLFSQMLTSYCALLAEGAALPRAAHYFADEEARDSLPAAEADADFWRGYLAEHPPQLSKINPASDVPSGPGKGRRIRRILPPEEGRRLNACCESEGISPAVLFQTALVIYLHSLNPGLSPVNFGAMISNRVGLEQKNMLGNFALELLHSVPVTPGDRVRDLYASVKSASLEAYRHARCSYEDILELAREQNHGLESLRDVLFSYLPPVSEEGRTFDLYWLANYCPETSLEFIVFNMADKDEFILVFDYREDVLAPDEAEKALEMILLIIEACRQTPLSRVQDLTVSLLRDGGESRPVNADLKRILQKYTSKAGLKASSRLGSDLNLDSFDVINIVSELEESFNFVLSPEDMQSWVTVGDIESFIDRRKQ